ncbi:MAG: hypothetical protein EXS31_14960 [Pedosphaera sp.]|nr:hypothetical protein [Pedosphaera sp.]
MPFRPEDASWWHLPGERHLNGANLSFLDGHVDHHPWLYTPKKPRSNNPGPQPTVNALDRKDLEWLVRNNAWWHWNVKTYHIAE